MTLGGTAERSLAPGAQPETRVVGCVPYLNAKPLVYRFRELGEMSPVGVVFDVPARLPAMLESGQVQAILVSSIEALRAPARVVDGVAIGSRGQVRSVRLFSKVPFDHIKRFGPDPSSMTSNALAQIVLREAFSVDPVLTDAADADAWVLIGDAGMRASIEGLHVLDLGEGWWNLTGLPFVWAIWLGDARLDTPLADELRASARWGEANLDQIVPDAAAETGFEDETALEYLGSVMDYQLGEAQREGLAEFGRRLVTHGLLERAFEPTWV